MQRKLLVRAGLVFAAALSMVFAIGSKSALAAPGDFVGEVTFSQDCGSGIGVGIAYDGQYLWVSCYASNPDLLRADPHTGAVSATYNIAGDLGAIAYDATHNVLWDAEAGNVYNIQLDAAHNVVSHTIAFSPGSDAEGLVDGVAYDGTNDTLYFKPDNSNPIHHYTTAGVKLADITGASSCFGPATSGLAIGGNDLYEGKDGCSHVFVVDKTTNAPVFDFSTFIASDPNHRDEGLSCDAGTFPGKQVMWSKEAYSPNRAAAYEIPAGTCGVGGKPAPKCVAGDTTAPTLSATKMSFNGVAGLAVTVDDTSTGGSSILAINAYGSNFQYVDASGNVIAPVPSAFAPVPGFIPGPATSATFYVDKVSGGSASITVQGIDACNNVADPHFKVHGKGVHGQQSANKKAVAVKED